MFTGIIETMGTVTEVQSRRDMLMVQIETAKNFLNDLTEGGSIAVDGVCLTAVEIRRDVFGADVIRETVSRTSFSTFRRGTRVNLERPLRFSDRLDGHLVQGHVDGTGTIKQKKKLHGNVLLSVDLPAELIKGVVKKGSIAIDGISLTVTDVQSELVTVALIPFTLEHTTLGIKKTGDSVNIETDIIGKYVERYFAAIKERKSMAHLM